MASATSYSNDHKLPNHDSRSFSRIRTTFSSLGRPVLGQFVTKVSWHRFIDLLWNLHIRARCFGSLRLLVLHFHLLCLILLHRRSLHIGRGRRCRRWLTSIRAIRRVEILRLKVTPLRYLTDLLPHLLLELVRSLGIGRSLGIVPLAIAYQQ